MKSKRNMCQHRSKCWLSAFAGLVSARAAFVCGVSLLPLMQVAAAEYTWSGVTSALWNISDENWSGAGNVWVNGSGSSAIFGNSGAGSITADEVTLNDLSFTADNYTVSGGPLLMHGSADVAGGFSATLETVITNTGVWQKTGSGTLVLDPGAGQTNLFDSLRPAEGTLRIKSGTTHVSMMGGAPETNPAFWVRGGTLVMDGGTLKTTGDAYARVSHGGTLLITNGVVDLLNNNELLNAHGSFGTTTIGGNGTLMVKLLRIAQYDKEPENSVVNINSGGTLLLRKFYIDAARLQTGTVKFNGGRVVPSDSNHSDFLGNDHEVWLNHIFARVMQGGAVFDTDNKFITIRQPLLSGEAGDGGVVKLGGGDLSLWGTNFFTGGVTVWEGGLNITNDYNLGAVPDSPATNLTFAGSGHLVASATHALHANRTLAVTNFTKLSFNPQSYTQTIHGVVAGATGSKIGKIGSGSVVFDPGEGVTNVIGSLEVDGGTLEVRSGVFNITTNATPAEIYNTLHVKSGTLLVNGGTLRTTGTHYGMTQNGGLVVTNGVANLRSLHEFLNAYMGKGSVTVLDGGTLEVHWLRISQHQSYQESNCINLERGGAVLLNKLYIDIGAKPVGTVNFNGGKLIARATQPDFMGVDNSGWLEGVRFVVHEGGVVVDSQGFEVGNKHPLISGAEVDGGFRKLGSGSFTFAVTNAFNGPTVVEEGTLVMGVDDALPETNIVIAKSGATFNVNGKKQVLATLGGGGSVSGLGSLSVTDTIAPGDSGVGTLTLSGGLESMEGATLAVTISDDNSTCGVLYVDGGLDLGALDVRVDNPAQLDREKRYLIASCSGTMTTPFNSTSELPRRWTVSYNANSKTAHLIYNFGTLIILR